MIETCIYKENPILKVNHKHYEFITSINRAVKNKCIYISVCMCRKSVVLEAYDKMIARTVSVEMVLTPQTWLLSASLYMEHSQSISGLLLASLQTNNSTVTSNLNMTVEPDENNESVCIIAFPVSKVLIICFFITHKHVIN